MSKPLSFVKATDKILGGRGDLSGLADELGCSVQSLRQARLNSKKLSYRPPPHGWQDALISVLRAKIEAYNLIIDRLEIEKDWLDT